MEEEEETEGADGGEDKMELYFDPKTPGSFGSALSLSKRTKRPLKKILNWLADKDAYTLHKPVISRFKRRKTYSKYPFDLWQADLADLSSIASHNDNYRFLLTCVDVFSRVARVLPIKNKSTKTVTSAFSKMLDASNGGRQLVHLQTDRGGEFWGAEFQKLMRERNIIHYSGQNDDIKCALVERFNRTLKTKMFKYFTHRNTLKYIDVLDDLVASYNNTYHSSIKMTPNEVTAQNSRRLHKRLYGAKKPRLKWAFRVGDSVRIVKSKRTFQKGYLGGWTREIFFVQSRHASDPPTYKLKDYEGEEIGGKFYKQELQKIKHDPEGSAFKIERVLKSRKSAGGVKEYFVKWLGYDDKFNSWTRDLIKVSDG